MSVMITTPAGTAMGQHGLTDACTILASDADLYPQRQGQNITPRAVAYSVLCTASGRFSLVTLDGRWIVPGRDGYKTRGPVATYARKNITAVRPDALVILEPVRHNGRYGATSTGLRRPGICRRAIGESWRSAYSYECSCGEPIQPDRIRRDGWVIVRDGRGSHTVSYALSREHERKFGECPTEVPETANVVIAGAPESAPATPQVEPQSESAAVQSPAPQTPSDHSGTAPEAPGNDSPQHPAGKHCPRCNRDALYGLECAWCGHIIITALTVAPCHPPAWSEGCCPRCLAKDPAEVFEVADRIMCATCADGCCGPAWRTYARRVVAWVDPPDELSYATQYAQNGDASSPAGTTDEPTHH